VCGPPWLRKRAESIFFEIIGRNKRGMLAWKENQVFFGRGGSATLREPSWNWRMTACFAYLPPMAMAFSLRCETGLPLRTGDRARFLAAVLARPPPEDRLPMCSACRATLGGRGRPWPSTWRAVSGLLQAYGQGDVLETYKLGEVHPSLRHESDRQDRSAKHASWDPEERALCANLLCW